MYFKTNEAIGAELCRLLHPHWGYKWKNGVASIATTLGSLPRSKNQIEGETALPRAARLLGLAQRPTAMKIYLPQILYQRVAYTTKVSCNLILSSTSAQYFH